MRHQRPQEEQESLWQLAHDDEEPVVPVSPYAKNIERTRLVFLLWQFMQLIG